jgi:hypothetical protein
MRRTRPWLAVLCACTFAAACSNGPAPVTSDGGGTRAEESGFTAYPKPSIEDQSDDALLGENPSAGIARAMARYRTGDARLAALELWTESLAQLRDSEQQAALFYLAKSLCRSGYAHACATQLERAIRPTSVYRSKALAWLAYLAEVLPETAPLERVIVHYEIDELRAFEDASLREPLLFLFGMERYHRQEWAGAEQALGAITSSSTWAIRAKLALGFSAAIKRDLSTALKRFGEVRKLAAGSSGSEEVADAFRLATLQTARVHFGRGEDSAELRTALGLYEELLQGGRDDDEARFEVAWVHARLDEPDKGLARLERVGPEFRLRTPEVSVLTAFLLTQKCRLEEAKSSLRPLLSKGDGVIDSLEGRGGGEAQRIEASIGRDAKLRRLSAAEKRIADEKGAIGADRVLGGSRLASTLATSLEGLQDRLAEDLSREINRRKAEVADEYRKQLAAARKLEADITALESGGCRSGDAGK